MYPQRKDDRLGEKTKKEKAPEESFDTAILSIERK